MRSFLAYKYKECSFRAKKYQMCPLQLKLKSLERSQLFYLFIDIVKKLHFSVMK